MSSPLDVNALFRVDGMVAAITGGGTGIGLIMAKALAANGASRVYLLGRRLHVLEAAAAAPDNAAPGVLVPLQCDVTNKTSLQAAVDRVAREAGFLNLLVVNAGAAGSGALWDDGLGIADLRRAVFDRLDPDAFTGLQRANVTSAFLTMGAFLELLDAANARVARPPPGETVFGGPAMGGLRDVPAVQSQIVVTSSVAAFSRSTASSPPYLASKAAVLQLTKQASSALAKHGIRVNALAPGLFPSEIAAGMIAGRKPDQEPYCDPRFIPARRFGSEQEMAGSILYLASRAGAYCSGSVLMMDGGRLSVMLSSY